MNSALSRSLPSLRGNLARFESRNLSNWRFSILQFTLIFATPRLTTFSALRFIRKRVPFLQRPAADALLRVQQKTQTAWLRACLIHDAYRPWYVHQNLLGRHAPPKARSLSPILPRAPAHNRACAVDLTLYDLITGKPVEMPGTYDEMSPRSFPDYPGGTSLQRWHRDLLRRAMEIAGLHRLPVRVVAFRLPGLAGISDLECAL